jgi:ankyrin repeat protein
MSLETIINTILYTDFQKDVRPILLTNKSFYNNSILWNRVVNKIKTKNNTTLLMEYALNNKYDRFKFLLDSGANIHMVDINNHNVMFYALSGNGDETTHRCEACNLSIIKELCENNFNLNNFDENLETPIFHAIRKFHNKAIKLFCNYDFDIRHKNIDNKSAMSLAIEYFNAKICYDLWKKGGDINSIDNKSRTFLMVAIAHHSSYEIIEEIVKNQNSINIRDVKGCNALKYAILAENINVIKLLLSNKADVNSVDNKGISCLMSAIYEKNVEIINILCDYNVNIEYRNNKIDAIKLCIQLNFYDGEKVLKYRLANHKN